MRHLAAAMEEGVFSSGSDTDQDEKQHAGDTMSTESEPGASKQKKCQQAKRQRKLMTLISTMSEGRGCQRGPKRQHAAWGPPGRMPPPWAAMHAATEGPAIPPPLLARIRRLVKVLEEENQVKRSDKNETKSEDLPTNNDDTEMNESAPNQPESCEQPSEHTGEGDKTSPQRKQRQTRQLMRLMRMLHQNGGHPGMRGPGPFRWNRMQAAHGPPGPPPHWMHMGPPGHMMMGPPQMGPPGHMMGPPHMGPSRYMGPPPYMCPPPHVLRKMGLIGGHGKQKMKKDEKHSKEAGKQKEPSDEDSPLEDWTEMKEDIDNLQC